MFFSFRTFHTFEQCDLFSSEACNQNPETSQFNQKEQSDKVNCSKLNSKPESGCWKPLESKVCSWQIWERVSVMWPTRSTKFYRGQHFLTLSLTSSNSIKESLWSPVIFGTYSWRQLQQVRRISLHGIAWLSNWWWNSLYMWWIHYKQQICLVSSTLPFL